MMGLNVICAVAAVVRFDLTAGSYGGGGPNQRTGYEQGAGGSVSNDQVYEHTLFALDQQNTTNTVRYSITGGPQAEDTDEYLQQLIISGTFGSGPAIFTLDRADASSFNQFPDGGEWNFPFTEDWVDGNVYEIQVRRS